MRSNKRETYKRESYKRDFALAQGGSLRDERRGREKLSRGMALLLGIFLTLEIMLIAAMALDIDFFSADMVGTTLAFMVLYSGVVAVLTDK